MNDLYYYFYLVPLHEMRSASSLLQRTHISQRAATFRRILSPAAEGTRLKDMSNQR